MRDYNVTSYKNTASIMATVKIDSKLSEYNPVVSYPHVSILELGEVENHDELSLKVNLPLSLSEINVGVLTAQATGIKAYGANGEYAVITLTSSSIAKLREKLIATCESLSIEVPVSIYEFSPHMTIGVLEDEESLPEFKDEFLVHLSEITIAVSGETIIRKILP